MCQSQYDHVGVTRHPRSLLCDSKMLLPHLFQGLFFYRMLVVRGAEGPSTNAIMNACRVMNQSGLSSPWPCRRIPYCRTWTADDPFSWRVKTAAGFLSSFSQIPHSAGIRKKIHGIEMDKAGVSNWSLLGQAILSSIQELARFESCGRGLFLGKELKERRREGWAQIVFSSS